MSVNGIRTTTNIYQPHRKPDIDNKLIRIEPESTPLFVILSRIAKKTCSQPEFSHFEKALQAEEVVVNGAVDDEATEIVLDSAAVVAPYDVLINAATMERMLVTAVNYTTKTVTVSRGLGDVAAAGVADDATLLVLGSAFQEGGDKAEAISGDPEKVTGQTQIFKTAIGMSDTQKNSEGYTYDDYDEEKREKAAIHKIKMEKALWFNPAGNAYIDGADGRARLSNGILAQITTNVQDVSGTLTEEELDLLLEGWFRYGSSSKTLFASARLMSILSGWQKNRWQPSSQSEKYGGLEVKEYINPHGKLEVVNAREIFKGSVFGYYGVGLDLKYLKLRTLKNRDTAIEELPTTKDRTEEQFLTECGLQFANEKAHFVIKNATTRG